MTYKIVSVSIFDPRITLFKSLSKDRATCRTISCSLEKCPLRDDGTCSYAPIMGWDACPYGQFNLINGPTKRARSIGKWIADRKAEHAGIPKLGYPESKIKFLGGYVFLPYAHIEMNESVPFLRHSTFASSGTRFVLRNQWTIDVVLSIAMFKPQAFFGGEILDYQKVVVPKFLLHLREADPSMWKALVERRPELDVAPNHVGRTALLKTLNSPIEWDSGSQYPVRWKWDGSILTTTSKNAYDSTWGALPLESLELRGIPADDAKVKVLDNGWVNEDTKFLD